MKRLTAYVDYFGAAGLIIGLIALYCAAIFLLFVFAGISIFTGCRDICRTHSGGFGVPVPAYSAAATGHCLVVHCDRTENRDMNVWANSNQHFLRNG